MKKLRRAESLEYDPLVSAMYAGNLFLQGFNKVRSHLILACMLLVMGATSVACYTAMQLRWHALCIGDKVCDMLRHVTVTAPDLSKLQTYQLAQQVTQVQKHACCVL